MSSIDSSGDSMFGLSAFERAGVGAPDRVRHLVVSRAAT
jgi:hypothetical protein